MRVVATAGHVDHGKSSLVLALTGTDPDRWDEEKRRGLTIDLGFAFTTLPSGTNVGFVDVPGHVRFLKNMLAGAGAVDTAVLVVAATEGWMPQTEEHLRILELLGVEHGFTVLTMADLVTPDALDVAALEVSEHLAGTFLSKAPLVACDSHSGRGLDDVRAALDVVVTATPAPVDAGRPRLWVDRVFSAKGAGTVVTGTLARGHVTVGDAVVVGPTRRAARVRSIQSGHANCSGAEPGARVALNLAGVERDEVARGDAVVLDGDWMFTTRVEVRLRLLNDAGRVRRARQWLKAYVGSGEHDSTVQALGEGFARIELPIPLPLAPGDRIVLRDSGAGTTVGGGEILEVDPPASRDGAADRLRLPAIDRALAAHGLTSRTRFVQLVGDRSALDEAIRAGAAREIGETVVAAPEVERILTEAQEAVVSFHAKAPLEPGIDLGTLATGVGADPTVLRTLLADHGELVVEGTRVRHASHRGARTSDPAAQRFLEALTQAPFAPPTPAETETPLAAVRALVGAGEVIETEGLYFSAAAYRTAVRRVRDALADRGTLTVGEVRDLLGSSRKHVLPLLHRMDREGVTRRRGDVREPGSTSA